MIHRPISTRSQVLFGIAGVLTLLVVYTGYSWWTQYQDPDAKYCPNWSQIWEQGVVSATTPQGIKGEVYLWSDFTQTFLRLFWALLFSVTVSLILGVAMGCFSAIEAFFLPPLADFSKIPATALLVIFFVLCGLTPKLFLAVVGFGLIPTLTQSFYLAAKEGVPPELLYKARTLGASEAECIWSVILPHIVPAIFEAVRLAVGPALIFLIAAELTFSSEGGVGARLRQLMHKSSEGMPMSIFYVALLGFIGLAIDYSLRRARSWCCPWYEEKQ